MPSIDHAAAPELAPAEFSTPWALGPRRAARWRVWLAAFADAWREAMELYARAGALGFRWPWV